MTQTASLCPKCGGEMIQGYQLEGTWVEGAWKTPALLKALSFEVFKFPGEKQYIPVGSFRCKSCGFLEQYARTEFAG